MGISKRKFVTIIKAGVSAKVHRRWFHTSYVIKIKLNVQVQEHKQMVTPALLALNWFNKKIRKRGMNIWENGPKKEQRIL